MEWYEVLALLIGGLVALMMLGLPVVFAFFAVNIAGAFVFMGGGIGVDQLVRNAVDAAQSFALLPIPLFILMGEIMFHTGVAGQAIDAVDRLIARVPGRLSLVAVAGGTIFSSLSGSTIANTAMLGSTLLPEMYRRGYRPAISIGPIVAVGGLAMLIPPSALAVLLGSIAQIPISGLLVGAVIPALILAALFVVYIVIRCRLNPELAPPYDIGDMSWRERRRALPQVRAAPHEHLRRRRGEHRRRLRDPDRIRRARARWPRSPPPPSIAALRGGISSSRCARRSGSRS